MQILTLVFRLSQVNEKQICSHTASS